MDDMNGHLDEGTIHAWLDGALAPDESARVEAHAASCAGCAALVAEARGLVAASARILSSLDDVPAGVIPGQASGDDQLAALRARRQAARPPWWRRREFLAAASLLFIVGTSTAIYRSLGNPVVVAPPAAADAASRVDSASEPAGAVPAPGIGGSTTTAPRREALTSAPAVPAERAKATMDATPGSQVGDVLTRRDAAQEMKAASPAAAESRVAMDSLATGQRPVAIEAASVPAPAPAATQGVSTLEQSRALQAQASAAARVPVQRLANEADFAGKGVPAAPGIPECYELRAVDPDALRRRGVPDRVRIASVGAQGDRIAFQAVAMGGYPGTTLAAHQLGGVVELLVMRAGDSTRVRFQRSATEAPAPGVEPGAVSVAATRIRCEP